MTPPMCFTVENACHVLQVFSECLTEVEEGTADTDLPHSEGVTPMDIPLSVINGETDDDDGQTDAKRPRYDDLD